MKDILVIDDEQDVLEIVRSVLKTRGFTVRTTQSGEEGIRLAKERTPDLIVCDLMMPKVSGMEVIKRLRASKIASQVPIVVLSAVAADSEKPADFWARGLGVDEFVEKPFDPLDLLGRVEALLRRGSYVSRGAPAGTPVPVAEKPDEEFLKIAAPREVARLYIEAWNNRDWETEYECLGEEMTGTYEKSDYLKSRENTWTVEDGARRQQRVAGVLEEKISGVIAKVVLEKKELRDDRDWRKKSTFTLKKTHKGWKIVRAREEPLTREETRFE